MTRSGLVFIMVWLMAGVTGASVTLPLEGYCKPGKYFPIQIDGTDTTHSICFSANGCLPTQMDAPENARAVVPMLVTGHAKELHWPDGILALRSPQLDERLIAGVTDPGEPVAQLFPGKRLLPIRLDPANLLPGPPASWETLDAIVLDASLFHRISDTQRSVLLAGGVMLVSIGDAAPDQDWPWQKKASCWVLSESLAGPVAQVVNENVYAPTFGWTPGWSSTVRGQVIGVALLLVLLMTGLMLRPNRWMISAAMGLSLLTTLAIIAWRHSLGTVDRAGGDILVADDGLVQRDAFVYERAKESSTRTVPWTGWTHPLFASETGLNSSGMALNVSPNATLSFIYNAASGHTLAFLRRDVQPGILPPAEPSKQSPMQDVAEAEYLNADQKIVGETPGLQKRWDSVFIAQRK